MAAKPQPKPKRPFLSKEMLELLQRERMANSPEADEKHKRDKAQKVIQFLEEHGISPEKFDPKNFSVFDDSFFSDKKAYPNYDQYSYIPGQHDVKKWLLSVKDIYYKQKAGLPYREAILQSTQGWKKMEIYDFLNWLRYHEEGSHMKYKFAQTWYENGQPGYFLHIKPDAVPEPTPLSDGNAVNDAREEAERNEEKRSIIEKQRQKIIGRLDSAEKLLRSPEGQQFAGEELENLMEAIYGLKKKVQLVNKLSISTRLYEDMIVREANILSRKGFTKAANMLHAVAQSPGQSGQGATGTDATGNPPVPASPPDPSGAGQSGTPQGQVTVGPNDPTQQQNQNENQPSAPALLQGGDAPTGTAQSAPPLPQEAPQPKGISEFIENMNEGNESGADDNLEVKDDEEELMVTEAFDSLLNLGSRVQDLYARAQVAVPPGVPPAALEDVPTTDAPAPARGKPVEDAEFVTEDDKPAGGGKDEPLEVTEDDIPKPGEAAVEKNTNFDAQIDNAFKNVTINDVVAKLEVISMSYKTREQPRQLSVVDMMLDSLGLASMFPSLSEALNKSLEANNYISTRVDDILSKLRGALASQDKAPSTPTPDRPEVAGIKGKLQSDLDKEKQRKQMRKEQEAAELETPAKETPKVEMGELAPPPAPPPPAAPAAAPARGPVARPLG
jgi:hypothetical protein